VLCGRARVATLLLDQFKDFDAARENE